jgi:hypothetical protein
MSVAVACGLYPNFDAAASNMVHREGIFEPNPLTVGLYAQLRDVYAEIALSTDASLERVHNILVDQKTALAEG